jgi:outer membrane protein assembly factor BamB
MSMKVSRRTLLAGAAGATVIGLTPGPARAATTGWWPAPGYTVGNSGFSQQETTILTSTVGRVTPKSTLLDGSTELGAPVLDNGRIFAADLRGITALSESTGAELWRYEYRVPPMYNEVVRLVIRDGVLTAGWNNVPGGSYVSIVTLNAATGALIAEAAPISYGAFRDLTVDRGFVAVTLWSGVQGTRDLGLFTEVLRRSDLRKVWDAAHYSTAPVLANGKLLLRSPRNHHTQIRDLATGTVLTATDGLEYTALAANDAGTTFYAARDDRLQAVDATTGVATVLASQVAPQAITVTPTRVYVTHGDLAHTVSAFGAATAGPAFWSRTFPATPLKPIIAGGVLYVTVPGDRVHVLNPVDGTSIATPAFTGVTALPVITNGRIYLTDGTRITTYGL